MVDEQRRERPNVGRRRYRRRRRTIPKPIFMLSGVVLLLAVLGIVLAVLEPREPVDGDRGAETEVTTEPDAKEPGTTATSVSFAAVGDNLINEGGDYTIDLLGLARAWGGGQDSYDFSPLYSRLSPTISSYDIAFVNQETVLGGDSFDYQGFPSYNTPDEVSDALVAAGFDVINCNTNHTYDLWVDPILHSQGVWAAHPEVVTIGSYASEEDRQSIRVVERKGLTCAFLSYSYGQNGYEQQDLPNDYLAVPFDKGRMYDEVGRARELADVVVVYMHWGDENSHELSEEQRDYASYLAGLGVDLVIGSHVHVVQPVEYVARGIRTTDGGGATAQSGMLCVYGLGDFVSGYTLPKTILSGMFTCDFVRDENGDVSIEHPVWHGLVEHYADGQDAVYPLSEYTSELAAANVLLDRVGEDESYGTDDPLLWARQTTRDVVGDAIEVEV